MQAPAVEGAAPAAERSGGPGGERSPRPQGASGGNSGGIMGQLMPQRPRMSRGGAGGAQAMGPGQTRYVWVLEGEQPVAVQVKTGISDGRMTEVDSEKLAEGAQVITDQRSGAAR
jgi:HlyD family secretion protein